MLNDDRLEISTVDHDPQGISSETQDFSPSMQTNSTAYTTANLLPLFATGTSSTTSGDIESWMMESDPVIQQGEALAIMRWGSTSRIRLLAEHGVDLTLLDSDWFMLRLNGMHNVPGSTSLNTSASVMTGEDLVARSSGSSAGSGIGTGGSSSSAVGIAKSQSRQDLTSLLYLCDPDIYQTSSLMSTVNYQIMQYLLHTFGWLTDCQCYLLPSDYLDVITMTFIDHMISLGLTSTIFTFYWIPLLYDFIPRFTCRWLPISDELLAYAMSREDLQVVEYALKSYTTKMYYPQTVSPVAVPVSNSPVKAAEEGNDENESSQLRTASNNQDEGDGNHQQQPPLSQPLQQSPPNNHGMKRRLKLYFTNRPWIVPPIEPMEEEIERESEEEEESDEGRDDGSESMDLEDDLVIMERDNSNASTASNQQQRDADEEELRRAAIEEEDRLEFKHILSKLFFSCQTVAAMEYLRSRYRIDVNMIAEDYLLPACIMACEHPYSYSLTSLSSSLSSNLGLGMSNAHSGVHGHSSNIMVTGKENIHSGETMLIKLCRSYAEHAKRMTNPLADKIIDLTDCLSNPLSTIDRLSFSTSSSSTTTTPIRRGSKSTTSTFTNVTDNNGRIHIASSPYNHQRVSKRDNKYFISICQYLIHDCKLINYLYIRDKTNHYTAFDYLLHSGNIDLITRFLGIVGINIPAFNGYTALMLITTLRCSMENQLLVKELCKRLTVNINAQDTVTGNTVIMHLVRRSDYEWLKYILTLCSPDQNGGYLIKPISFDIKNNQGMNLFHLLERYGTSGDQGSSSSHSGVISETGEECTVGKLIQDMLLKYYFMEEQRHLQPTQLHTNPINRHNADIADVGPSVGSIGGPGNNGIAKNDSVTIGGVALVGGGGGASSMRTGRDYDGVVIGGGSTGGNSGIGGNDSNEGSRSSELSGNYGLQHRHQEQLPAEAINSIQTASSFDEQRRTGYEHSHDHDHMPTLHPGRTQMWTHHRHLVSQVPTVIDNQEL